MDDKTTGAQLPPISVGMINFNGGAIAVNTLRSILDNGYPKLELFMVDDQSTDNTIELVKKTFPQIKIYEQSDNMGPNVARNRVLKEAGETIIFVTDNDITLESDCLKLLVQTMMENDDNAIVTPMILDSQDNNKIYSNGARLHYACFGMIPDRYKTLKDDHDKTVRQTVCGSGGIMLVKKDVALSLGGYDSDFYFGYTDGEFSYRVSSSGKRVMQVPSAKIYHLEKPGRNPKRLRFQIRGRWDLILKSYAARTLILLAPALLLFELAQLSFLATKGQLGEWVQGMRLLAKDISKIMKKRKAVQAVKKIPDKELLSSGEIFMFHGRLGALSAILKKIFEAILNTYWALIRPVLTK